MYKKGNRIFIKYHINEGEEINLRRVGIITETKLLELTSDPVFKAFMLSEETRVYKAKLIHLITGIDYDKLLNATYVSKELAVTNKNNKVYSTDIVVEIENNILNIEMNNSYYKGLFYKNNSYLNKIRSESYEVGDDYLDIEAVIQINIDNFTHYKGNKLIYKFEMREKETGELECEKLESYHIDLEYLRNNCYNEISNELEKLLQLFIIEDKYNLEKLRSEKYMEKAINELEKLSNDERIIGLYDKEKVARKTLNTQLKSAKLEGIEERNIEIAKNMLNEDINLSAIVKCTGLTEEEINSLK